MYFLMQNNYAFYVVVKVKIAPNMPLEVKRGNGSIIIIIIIYCNWVVTRWQQSLQ